MKVDNNVNPNKGIVYDISVVNPDKGTNRKLGRARSIRELSRRWPIHTNGIDTALNDEIDPRGAQVVINAVWPDGTRKELYDDPRIFVEDLD